mmetsp:Transcript_42216/g.119795  ORF Transcript_42216/g.119795 Transcript_42216/m.119795 type:complete len:122 (+) Transcript_42216:1216-1581(+)
MRSLVTRECIGRRKRAVGCCFHTRRPDWPTDRPTRTGERRGKEREKRGGEGRQTDRQAVRRGQGRAELLLGYVQEGGVLLSGMLERHAGYQQERGGAKLPISRSPSQPACLPAWLYLRLPI